MKKFLILTFTILTFIAPAYFCNADSIVFIPESGKVGAEITIESDVNLTGATKVLFGNTIATIKENSQSYSLIVSVPVGAINGKISVTTQSGSNIISDTDFIVTPAIGIGTTGGVTPPPIIASGTTTTYKVVSGDTLGGIATKFSTTIAKLMELNSIIIKQDDITVGWLLKVPNTLTATGAITFDGKSLVPTCNTGAIDAEGNYINKCDFNMVMALVNKVISFCLIYLATPLFALIMIYVGYLYLTASASSENINLAKKILKNALFGYVIALAAWLVVKSVLATLGVIGIDKYIQ